MDRKAIAQDTLKILEDGYYQSPEGNRVDIATELISCIAQTKCYDLPEIEQIQKAVFAETPKFSNTVFAVKNETTLMGAEFMARSQQFERIGVLNFASAKNPGGGFLRGAQAQEESLARSSGLYKSLLKCPEYYDYHRANRSLLYSDYMIYSPGCPVFKKDDGTLLSTAYVVDFITSPAPNAGEIEKQQPEDKGKINEVLYIRGAKLLSLAAYHQCDALVLGAWGCGVFRNNPSVVAQMFADLLLANGQFSGRFKSVLFSVLDTRGERKIFPEFSNRFG
ncbi:TIGR02452 family protein [[Phormidium ambiguum] IAM M-71]|uniref:TIGR02452 family protein n=1 Tax=[Phormidium ambiguum] IAM M-71 TaxID=454136 RepID=A0A1U7IRQ1_9CYAN|nr:TIGR02452 family protein [Phormidium ambiguum]OKH40076.1 TIGR02452 family protein [Phormidium ambiguum IAM M-71]